MGAALWRTNRMKVWGVAAVLVVLGLAGVAFAGAAPPGHRPHLRTPGYLDQAGRTALDARMKAHPDEMTRLMTAVTLLDSKSTRKIAQALSEELPLPRSLRLPADVWTLDDQFHDRARGLAAAADSGDQTAMAQRFGDLVQVCVACHQAYLYRSPTSPSPPQK